MVVTRWYSVVWGRLRTIYCIESARHGRQSQSKKRLYNQSGWIFSRIRTFRSPYSVQHTQSTYHCILHLPLLINTARTALETSRGKINWKPLGKETLPELPFRLPRRLLNGFIFPVGYQLQRARKRADQDPIIPHDNI